MLKHVELNYCSKLTLVEIRDANLMCFIYNGERLKEFVLENVPRLVEMHFGGDIVMRIEDFIPMLSSHLTKLERLTLDSLDCQCFGRKGAMMLCTSVKMSNLKHLVVKFFGEKVHFCDLMPLTYFIRASPLLQTFVLEAYDGDTEREQSLYFVKKLPFKAEVVGLCRYPHLKRAEIVGYRGTSP